MKHCQPSASAISFSVFWQAWRERSAPVGGAVASERLRVLIGLTKRVRGSFFSGVSCCFFPGSVSNFSGVPDDRGVPTPEIFSCVCMMKAGEYRLLRPGRRVTLMRPASASFFGIQLMADSSTISPTVAVHGAYRLLSVDVDCYNVELKDDGTFLGDRASKGAFRAMIEHWRKPLRKIGVDPFGDCMSSEHFGQFAWQFERMSGSSGLKVQAAIAC
jgi:hypothetical protein